MLTDSINSSQSASPPPPPLGSSEKAEKYLNQLINLISQGKVEVTKTDLSKLDITSLQDHYFINLKDYEVEVSHSKQPDSGRDFYVILFNNLKVVRENSESCTNKVILAYAHLTQQQFIKFKSTVGDFLEKRRKEEEDKRFQEALVPIDQALTQISTEEQPLAGADNHFDSTTPVIASEAKQSTSEESPVETVPEENTAPAQNIQVTL